MARDTAKGQSYPLLNLVKDPGTQQVLRMLMDQINELRQPSATQDLGGNTFSGVPTPTAPDHVSPKSYVDSSVAGVRASLLGAGATPLDITGLRGQASQVQRAKLRVNPAGNPLPSVGQHEELLYDVDTAQLYYFNTNGNEWVAL